MPVFSKSSRPFRPRFGAVVDDSGVTFRVWAPAQKSVALALDEQKEIDMQPEDGGYFSVRVKDARAGQRYRYRIQQGLRADPASRFQPEGPLGPSEIVDPRDFKWSDAAWTGAPEPHRHVLYEMHLGTFTEEGTWAAAERQLPFLKDVGITTLEIMPIAEFAGRFGWGYDGVHFFAPTHLYGAPNDLRHFIDTAHNLGLAVILDVVYNHFGPVGNFVPEFSDTFLGGEPGDWGDSINFDGPGSEGVRAFVIENATYWIAEFHFDGLRLDATHAIHDTSKEHIISELSHAARQTAGSRRIFICAESESQDSRLLKHSGVYSDGVDAIWNEDWHHTAFVALARRRQAYFTDYQGTAPEFASMARHGFLYQGQFYTWQKNRRGGFSIGLPGASFVHFLENHDQVANTGLGWRLYQHVSGTEWRALTALLLLGSSLPMLFQGQEFASSRPFAYFADHEGELAEAVRQGRHKFLAQFPPLANPGVVAHVPDPASEETFRNAKLQHSEHDLLEHAWTVALHRDLIRLRRDDELLSRLGTPEIIVESSALDLRVLVVRYMTKADDRLLVINIGADFLCPMNDPLLAPRPGRGWALQWSSEDPKYGGGGTVPLAENDRWLIVGGSAMLMRTS